MSTPESDSKISALNYAARATVLCITIIVPVALFYGRQLERAHPNLIHAVALFGLIVAIGLFTSAIAERRKRIRETRHTPQNRETLTLMCTIVGALLSCEYFIQFPIERIHFIKYALLSGAIPLTCDRRRVSKLSFLLGFLVAASVGVAEESAQAFVPERFFDLRDIRLNLIGALFGVLISWQLFRPDRLHTKPDLPR